MQSKIIKCLTCTITSAMERKKSVSDKPQYQHTIESEISDMLDPKIDFKHKPVNPIEEFAAAGQVSKSINVGVNKMISNNAVIDNYKASISRV